jgi:hypothetical protein
VPAKAQNYLCRYLLIALRIAKWYKREPSGCTTSFGLLCNIQGFFVFTNMTIEIPVFEGGCYRKDCELFPDITIGTARCVGHAELGIKPCKYCTGCKKEATYWLSILKEHTPIVSEVSCNRPIKTQIELF